MDTARTCLELLRKHIDDLATGEAVFGPNRALQMFASQFLPAPDCSTRLRRGPPKRCYANATGYAAANKNLFYVEGYAIDPEFPLPLEHAWLIDKTGAVLDPTWEDAADSVYFGIPFRTDFLMAMIEHDAGGDALLSWPLMRKHFGTPNHWQRSFLPKRTDHRPFPCAQ